MATLAEILANPAEYLGTTDDPAADARDLDLFEQAVNALIGEEGYSESEAVVRVWGNGDFISNAETVLGIGDAHVAARRASIATDRLQASYREHGSGAE